MQQARVPTDGYSTGQQQLNIQRRRAVVLIHLDMLYNESNVNLPLRVLELILAHNKRGTELSRQTHWGQSQESGSLGFNCCNEGVAVITCKGQHNVSNIFCSGSLQGSSHG